MAGNERLEIAEQALTLAAAVVAMRRRGLPRAKIAETLGLSGRQVWVIEYSLGLTNNADDKMAGVHPRTMRIAGSGRR